MLVTRQKQFQRRLARKFLNRQEESEAAVAAGLPDPHADANNSSSSSSHATTSSAAPLGASRQHPGAPPSAATVAAMLDENGNAAPPPAASRAALGAMSHRTANTVGARRPAGAAAHTASTGTGSTTAAGAAAAGAGNKSNNGTAGFEIFADTSAPQPFAFLDDNNNNHGGGSGDGSAPPLWSDLPPLEERIKENTDIARRWNDPSVVASLAPRPATARLPPATSNTTNTGALLEERAPLLRPHVPPPSARPVPAGAIFVEDAFATAAAAEDALSRPHQGNTGSNHSHQHHHTGGGNAGLSVRAVLDRPATATETLAQNPLAFFDQKPASSSSSSAKGDQSDQPDRSKEAKKREKKAPLADRTTTTEGIKEATAAVAPAAVPGASQNASVASAPAAAAPFDFECGFKPELVAPASEGGQEQCFEEHRAARWLLLRNQKANHSTAAAAAAGPLAEKKMPLSSSASGHAPAAPAVVKRKDDDVTINTSTALEAMSDIFGQDDSQELAAMWGSRSNHKSGAAAAAAAPALKPLSFHSSSPLAAVAPSSSSSSSSNAGPFALSSTPPPPSSSSSSQPFAAAAGGGGLQTPPPTRLPFAIFADNNNDSENAGAAAGNENRSLGPQNDGENAVGHPVNPAARTVAAVVAKSGEAAVLREMSGPEIPGGGARVQHPHQPEAAAEEEEEDENGAHHPMPEESEIYRNMLGLPENADDEVHRSHLRGLGAELNFAIYCDEDEGNNAASSSSSSSATNVTSLPEDATADANALAGLMQEAGCGDGASSSSAAMGSGDGGTRRATASIGSFQTWKQDMLGGGEGSAATKAPSAGTALPFAIFSDSDGDAAPFVPEPAPAAPAAAPFAIFNDNDNSAADNDNGSGAAAALLVGGGDNTAELGTGLQVPQLSTMEEVASPSGRGRRATADPAFLLDMLAQFQDDDQAGPDAAAAPASTTTSLLPAAPPPATTTDTGLPFTIFQDN